MEGKNLSELVPAEDRKGATIGDKEGRVKERWVKRFESMLSRNKVTGHDLENNVTHEKWRWWSEDLFWGIIKDSTKMTRNN